MTEVDFTKLLQNADPSFKFRHDLAQGDAKNNLEVMLRCCTAELGGIRESLSVPAPAYFERVAIILRKQKRLEDEAQVCLCYLAACETWATQVDVSRQWDPRTGGGYRKIQRRLARVEELLKSKQTLDPRTAAELKTLVYTPHRPLSFPIADPASCGTPLPREVFQARNLRISADEPIRSWMAFSVDLVATRATHGLKAFWEGFGKLEVLPGNLDNEAFSLSLLAPMNILGWLHLSLKYPEHPRQSESLLVALRKRDDDLGLIGVHGLTWVSDSEEYSLSADDFCSILYSSDLECDRQDFMLTLKSVTDHHQSTQRNGPFTFQGMAGGESQVGVET